MGGSTTSTSSSSPPPQFLAAYQALLGQAGQVASQPLQQYSGNTVAGLSGDQQAGISTIQNSQGIANPYINSAAQYFGQAATPITTNAINNSQDAANATWSGVNANTTAATQAASQAGTTANAAASQGAGLAVQGATSNAALANQYASTNVYNQLPTYNSAQGVSQYMSPYTQSVVNSTQAEENNQNAQTNQGIVGNAISSGAWGGDRAGVAQGIAAGQESLADSQTIAGLENTGYTNAQSEFNTQQGLQASLGQSQAQIGASTALGAGNLINSSALGAGGLQANTALGAGNLASQSNLGAASTLGSVGVGLDNAGLSATGQQLSADQANAWLNSQAGYGMAGLGTEAQNTTLAGANAQLTAGGLEQNQEQEQLNVPYEQFEAQQAYPFQTTSWLGSLVEGLGGASGGTSSTTSPGPDFLSELLGAGTTLGAAALLGGKRGGAVVPGGLEPIARRAFGGLVPRGIHMPKPISLGMRGPSTSLNMMPRRDSGGLVPDVSISYVPSSAASPHTAGGGPPRPPAPVKQQNGMSSSGTNLLASAVGKKIGAGGISSGQFSKFANANPTDLGGLPVNNDAQTQVGADLQDSMGISPGGIGSDEMADAAMDFRRGGFVRRAAGGSASGGGGGGIFTKPLTTKSGMKIPQLSTAPKPAPGIAANLTQDYGNAASDASGKSTLPSTTYWPAAGATTMNPASPSYSGSDNLFSSLGGGGTYDSSEQFRGGGKVKRYDDGGDVDDDDDGSPDMSGGLPAPPDAPFATIPHDGPPTAAVPGGNGGVGDDGGIDGGVPGGLAPTDAPSSRYASQYKPVDPAAPTSADRKQALGMALLSAGLGTMAGGSHFALQNIGRGGLEGIKAYMGAKEQQLSDARKAADDTNTGNYRAETLRMKGVSDEDAAKKMSDELEMRRDSFKKQEDQLTETSAHNKAIEAAAATRANQGDWDYLGPSQDDPTKGAYMNKHTGETKNGSLVGAKPAPNTGGLMSPEAVDFAAGQLLAGDTSVVSSFGMGNSGTANKVAVRNRMTQMASERGLSSEDIAAKNAEYFGTKAGERTLGTRSANIEMAVNEASNMGVLARQASDALPRTGWMPINSVLSAIRTNSDTNLTPQTRAFGASLNSYLNAYATAVGKGTMTVSSRDHADEMLSKADGPKAFNAVMDQLDKEMQAAREAPQQVRGALHDSVTGKPTAAAPAANAQPAAAPKPPEAGTIYKGHKFLGGDPSKPQNWQAVTP